MNKFKLKKDERPIALVAFLVFACQNALTLYRYHEEFTRVGYMGLWTLFHGRFHVSGFDAFSCIYLSNGKIFYELSRHPLFGPILAPLYWINAAIIRHFDFNAAIYLMAALLTVCATWSFLLMHRILTELVGLRRTDALLLSALLFSFASVMLAAMLPDHFLFSLFLLLLTLYLAGRNLLRHRPMPWWQTALLFFFTAGVTLSNGAKTLLASLFTNGKAYFRPRHLLLSTLLPLALLGAAYYAQYVFQLLPRQRESAHIEAMRIKKDSIFVQKSLKHEARKHRIIGRPMGNDALLKWTDKDTPRLQSLIENVFGESIQLHREHLLEDMFVSRPVIVHYHHGVFYVVEAAICLLFVLGLWCARHERLLWLCLSWLGCDVFLHLVLGFGLNEVYIMGAHWLFILPLAIAFLLKRLPPRSAVVLRLVLLLLTLYLWAYNGTLIAGFMLA